MHWHREWFETGTASGGTLLTMTQARDRHREWFETGTASGGALLTMTQARDRHQEASSS